jgi:putative zinc finger protein
MRPKGRGVGGNAQICRRDHGARLSSAARGESLSDDCLEPEQLSDYLAGFGSDIERRRIEAHLADCAECRQIIALIVRSETAVPAPREPQND